MKRQSLVPDKSSSAHKAAGQDKNWAKGDNRFLVGSLGLHVFVVAVLLTSWSFSDPVKQKPHPASIQARVLTAAEMEALRASKQELKQREQKAKQEEKRKKEARKKQQEERKRAQEIAKKKKQEQARIKEKQRKAAIEKKRQAEAQKLALKKKKEEEQKRRDREQKEREQKAQELEAIKAREKERERKLAQKLAEADQREVPVPQSSGPVISSEQISEKERFVALILSRVVSRWHIPPNSRGLKVVLQINLLPSGESTMVSVLSSSGNVAFDNSALIAARAVRVFPVPQDPVLFDTYFRKLIMSFTPPD